MRTSLFALLLPLLLGSCQGPRLKVVINNLQPGMLKGKTVGLDGLVITSSNWPGKGIDAPVLSQAEKVLQSDLKEARVSILPEAISEESGAAEYQRMVAGKPYEARPRDTDYIFKIMLRANSVSNAVNLGRDLDFLRLRNVSGASGTYNALGWNNPNPRSGVSPFRGGPFTRRELTTRTVRADYVLTDAHTHKILWRAQGTASAQRVNLNNTATNYQTPAELAERIALEPLWISMNTAAARSLKKSGASSH
ncbi:hypothetical protein [Prosthecobacter sp.]|uniref:hypothetical protein n=1 Tax=Prosthecobacter sp. TaxID=1965333 RepID=UPI0037845AAD